MQFTTHSVIRSLAMSTLISSQRLTSLILFFFFFKMTRPPPTSPLFPPPPLSPPTPPPPRPADGPMPPVRRGDGPGLRRSLEHARRAPLVQRLRDAPAVRHDRRGDRPQRRIEDGVALRRPLREMPTHLGVVLRT